jgi:hypothetical protein
MSYTYKMSNFAIDPDAYNSPTVRLNARIVQYLMGQDVPEDVIEGVMEIVFNNINQDDVVSAKRKG